MSAPAQSVRTASTRSPAAPISAPTWRCRACCTARSSAARMPTPASSASKSRRRWRCPGCKAVVTAADFPEIRSEEAFVGEGPMNFRDLSRNVMARDKVLYEGHAVAAVAATLADNRRRGARADRGRVRGAAARHRCRGGDGGRTRRCCTTISLPRASSPSRESRRTSPSESVFSKGDAAAGFRQADVVVERRYTTQPVHQAYIEPHACVVSVAADGQVQIWACSQGQFMIRAYCAKLLGIDIANIRVTPAEIGGGFGGKTLVYLEPVALALSKKTGRRGQDRDDPRRGVPRPPAQPRAASSRSSSAPRGTAPSSPPSSCSNTRPARSPARR